MQFGEMSLGQPGDQAVALASQGDRDQPGIVQVGSTPDQPSHLGRSVSSTAL